MKILLFFLIITNLFAQTLVKAPKEELNPYTILKEYEWLNEKYYLLKQNEISSLINKGYETYTYEQLKVKSQMEWVQHRDKKWWIDFVKYNEIKLGEEERDITIFILDTGAPIDTFSNITHEDFKNRKIGIWKSYTDTLDHYYGQSQWDKTNVAWDKMGHGTHVAGIINDLNITDSIIIVKVFNSIGYGLWSWIIEAVKDIMNYQAITGRTVIINCSWGGMPNLVFEKYLHWFELHNNKIFFVAAAGNTSSQMVIYPGLYSRKGFVPGHPQGYNNIINVGALTIADREIRQPTSYSFSVPKYSAFGSDIDIFAPGGSDVFWDSTLWQTYWTWNFDSTAILSSAPNGKTYLDIFLPRFIPHRVGDTLNYYEPYRYLSGTSMAAPIVTAIASEILGQLKLETWELKKIFKEHGEEFTYIVPDTSQGRDPQWGKFANIDRYLKLTNVEKEFTIIKYQLYQNYPNPFNPTTIIKFDLPKDDFISLKIFDILGREIKTIIEGQLMKGTYERQFTANLPSGIYFYTLKTSDFTETKKLQVIK